MKLLILSDSHGEQEFMQLAVRRERPDAVIHLGDHCADAATASSRGCSAFLLRRRSSRRRSRCSAIPTFPIAGRRAASGC